MSTIGVRACAKVRNREDGGEQRKSAPAMKVAAGPMRSHAMASS
jgi:hypothetical protein